MTDMPLVVGRLAARCTDAYDGCEARSCEADGCERDGCERDDCTIILVIVYCYYHQHELPKVTFWLWGRPR